MTDTSPEESELCSSECQLQHIRDSCLVSRLHHISGDQIAPRDEDVKRLTAQIYYPLLPQQCRIVKILPGTEQRPLVCRLLRATLTPLDGVRLDEENHQECLVDYDALSYSWGWPAKTCSVTCNEIQFPVTPHLKSALHNLRLPNQARYLWTDAFCINQYDSTEKGEQVQLMFTIFRKARKVIGWLGSSPNRSEHEDLFAWLQLASRQAPLKWHRSWMDDLLCNCLTDILGRCVLELIQQNSWFRRTWIRQEVFAAKTIEMRYGPFVFDLQLLSHLVRHIHTIEHRSEIQQYKTMLKLYNSSTHVQSDARSIGTGRTRRWLDVVLSNAQGFEASEPQDRIFALQNMAQPEEARHQLLFPTIDYRMPVEELFEQFIKRLLNGCNNLNPLGILEDRRGFEVSGLPSWVPDWRKYKTRLASSKACEPFELDLSQPRILSMNGVLLGVIRDDSSMHCHVDFAWWNQTPLAFGQYSTYRPFRSRLPSDEPLKGGPKNLRVIEEIAYKVCDCIWEEVAVESSRYAPYVLVSAVVRPGDLLASFDKHFAELTSLGYLASTWSAAIPWSAAIRECTSEPGKYIFLGRCVFGRPRDLTSEQYSFHIPSTKTKRYDLI